MTVMPLAVVAAAVAATAWRALGLVLLAAALLAALAWGVVRLRALGIGPWAPPAEDDDLPPLLLRPPASGTAPRPAAVAPAPRPAVVAPAPQVVSPPQQPGAPVEVGSVRFHRPPEGTLQLLPGRLEILAGSRRVEEIRFVRVPGRPAAVTFGRGVGEPHTHVQLEAPTVSRLHARMSYEAGTWRIANLSGTNPVCVNGAALSLEPGADTVLEDGDEVEMGQVVYRFRAR